MNAKKIMGAVLVALLAAALFVGAGSAAQQTVENGDTVFLYQDISELKGTWTLDGGSAQLTQSKIGNQYYFAPTENFVEGIYKNGTSDNAWSITIKYPTPAISVLGDANGKPYIITNDGTAYKDNTVDITVGSPNDAAPTGIKITLPDGTTVPESAAVTDYSLGMSGKYEIKAIFNEADFVNGAPYGINEAQTTFVINVVSADDVTISADAQSVIKNKIVTLTITGVPGLYYNVSAADCALSAGQTLPTPETGGWYFQMPNTGKATFKVTFDETGSKKVTVKQEGATKATATINVVKGTITAKADKESYYIGDDVEFSGTSTVGGNIYLYIAGNNVKYQAINMKTTVANSTYVNTDDTWKLEVDGAVFQGLDAGTYTVYASATKAATIDDLDTYETVSLVLKQPFISVTDAPAVAVQGSKYTVTGTAEATDKLAVYIFGTNFFAATNGQSVVVGQDAIGSSNPVSLDGNAFTVEFKINKDNMSAGQYFMVIQHPMYDEYFNIYSKTNSEIWLENKDVAGTLKQELLFTVDARQTANAAQALCDELDRQAIDDMYVKLSFVVAAPSSVINPIPSEITKGSKLTVSGTTNMGEGEIVTVEMLSTAFAAVPKETVGSASFISLTTKTDENGNWEIVFDTTGLNVDEYTVTAAVAGLNSATAKVNVIEGAPTEQPTTTPTTQPTQTEQPTETPVQTPGFGALAALAGLGAVAVLLLRRE